MIFKWFFDISTGFRFQRSVWECSVHICSCPWSIAPKEGNLLKQEYRKINNRFCIHCHFDLCLSKYIPMFYKIDRIGENRKSGRCSLQACSSNKLLKEKPVKEKRKCNWKTVVMNGGGLLQEDRCIYDSHAKARRQIHSLKFVKYIPNKR